MPLRYLLRVLPLVLLLGATAVQAQTTFTVTVAVKTADHPYNGQGWPEGFVIDGDQGAELTLTRGETYVFQMSGVPAMHPFFISTSTSGGDGGVSNWSEGVTNNGATGNEALTFTVPLSAPDELWYQCQNHGFMGYRLNIVGGTGSEDEAAQPAPLRLAAAFPNPFPGRTTVLLSLDEPQDATVEVFDAAGRRVAVLHRGPLAGGTTHALPFDGAGLRSGTYLVLARAGGHTVAQRVTLLR